MEKIKNKKGKFWILNKKDSFEGELIYINNRVYLHILDYLDELDFKEAKIIKGTVENMQITLYQCHLIYYEYIIFRFLFKNHTDKNLFFKEIEVKFYNLENWILKSDIEQKESDNIKISANKKEYTTDKFKLTLLLNKNSHETINTFNVSNNFKIKIEYFEKIHFDDIMKDLNIINNFLNICMYKQTNIQSLKLENAISVFNPNFNNEIDNLNFYNIFIPFNLISKNFGEVLSKWFEINDMYKNTIYLYLMNISYKTNAETMFLTYSQALEAFIRKNNNFDKFYMNFEDYENIKDNFYNAMNNMNLDKDHRQSLKSRIDYGNEYSLRKRLKMLISYLEGYNFIEMINEKYNGKFIKCVVDTRNYYTHYGDEAKYKTSGKELVSLSYDMKLLLELCLLHELNLPKELINSCLSKKTNNRLLLQ